MSWIEAQSRVPAAFARGVRQMKTGGAERRAVGALDKRWVTTRRSSLGDFGHSRLALRREGSDRHRGCYPTDPTGEGCPSFRRDGSSIPKGGVPSSRGQVFHPVRRAGLPLSAGADENPPPAKPEDLPPDLRSPSPSAGPWGNALLRRALRRSRTRPRRSPGRASSQLHAKSYAPARQAAFRRPPGTAERYSTGAGAASPPRHRPLRKRPLLGEE